MILVGARVVGQVGVGGTRGREGVSIVESGAGIGMSGVGLVGMSGMGLLGVTGVAGVVEVVESGWA